MPTVVVIVRLLLGAVFAVAGVVKLLDRRGTEDAAVAFGAPDAFAPALAIMIPAAELAAAALLLPAATAAAGAVLCLVLLLVFSVTVAVNLARGRAPHCHCFGQLHSAPAGPRTLARNGVLAVAAVFVLVAGQSQSAVGWIARLHGAGLAGVVGGVLALAVIVGGTLAFISLLRSYGRVLLRLDRVERALAEAGVELPDDSVPELNVVQASAGLAPGTPAPAFAAPDLSGAGVTLKELLGPGLPLMLVFASPQCGPCSALLPEVAEWQREHSDRVTVAVASDGSSDDVRAEAEELALERVLIDAEGELQRTFKADGTPSAVLIAPDGRVSGAVAAGRDAVESLLRGLLDAPGVSVGEPAPQIELPSLDGERVTLADHWADSGALLLFWDPDCGFCRALHKDLLAWEATVPAQGPRLLVVSSGDRERTHQDGFRSMVLLDPAFATAHEFGAGGTPAAVAVGADGRVASGVAVGVPAVWALARAGAGEVARAAV